MTSQGNRSINPSFRRKPESRKSSRKRASRQPSVLDSGFRRNDGCLVETRLPRMTTHVTPLQCLQSLTQQVSDGGRSEFLEQELRRGCQHNYPTGDCTIVAAVHAKFQKPTGQAYGDVRSDLDFIIRIRPKMFNRRQYGESTPRFVLRRIKQIFRPPNREPMHGTPNEAAFSYLWSRGYRLIYPNTEGQWLCICDPHCSYFVDIAMPAGGHSICVQQGTAYSTTPFYPEEAVVTNVMWLGSEETAEFRALRRYREDEEAWLDKMDKMIDSQDWEQHWANRPNLDDYRNK